MTAIIKKASRAEIGRLISSGSCGSLGEDEVTALNRCLRSTARLWLGFADDQFVCMWGLIPPTLLSQEAYLWLLSTEAVKEHEFIFVRNSQLAIEGMLKEFPIIVGHVAIGAKRSIRWIKWLGGVLGEPEGKLISFRIGVACG